MAKINFVIFLCLYSVLITAQSPFSQVPIENIGPTIMSGRVTELAVNPDNPTTFYVSYASGGLWYTENNGTTFTPLFDDQSVMTIGAIAVDWKSNTIYVGTGEVNSSRSSYAGNGVYKSTDQGKTWIHLGLEETHHIGRIVIDPKDVNTVMIAALGHLYTDNVERGIFKTTDGGKTWSHTLKVDDKTGSVDLTVDPTDTNIYYAACWQRDRKAWNFTESGPGSGIYKSVDKGESWTLITAEGSGFPTGNGVGRIGLDIAKTKTGTRLYALLDNYYRREKKEKKSNTDLTKDDFKAMSKSAFLNIEEGKLATYLKSNNFPEKYSAAAVKKMAKEKKIVAADLATYLENANRLLFDTPVIGAELYKSDDGGKTWTKTHKDYIDGLFNSYGYYFAQVRVYPHDPEQVIIMGVPILHSGDAGATWTNINGENVHVDHHALWINPKNNGHLINGNDGGINISYDHGKNWIKCNSPAVGQFYYINIDNAEPYNVYGGLQDNGVWKGSHHYSKGVRWHQTGRYPYKSIMGGDGMQIQIDNRNTDLVYTGFQFGNYFRINVASGKRKYITPMHDLGDRPYRWNWQSPILLSHHNQDILYMGCNKLMRSMDKGETFTAISDDLTNGGKKGDVAYGTLASIDESKLKFGLIYTGSDDGKIYRTKNGGNDWTEISTGLPQGLWVSRIQASAHKEAIVYATLNGYRNDDFSTYVYKSEDYGDTWKPIATSLKNAGPANVIKEDPNHAAILFIGTDHGTYVSVDHGENFMEFSETMPNVPVHDLVIHGGEKHLLIGTHGRSIYKADISYLYDYNNTLDKDLHLFVINDIKHSNRWGSVRNVYTKANEKEISLIVHSKTAGKGTLNVYNQKNKKLLSKDIELQAGIATVTYDLSIDEKNKKHLKDDKTNKQLEAKDNGKYYLTPGEYKVEIVKNGSKANEKLTIKNPK